MNLSNTTYTNTDYAALLLRLALGIMFLAHAWLKISVYTFAGTIGFFESVGIPLASLAAYATVALELTVGTLLIAGIATRIASLVSIPIILGAIFFVHGSKGWLFTNEGGGWEYCAFIIVALLAQTLLGEGAFSLKHANFLNRQKTSEQN